MTTILISLAQVGLVRATLAAHREQALEAYDETAEHSAGGAARLRALDALLAQVSGAPHIADDGSVRLRGDSDVLFSLLYDIVGQQAELVQEQCLDYWRGTPAEEVRQSIVDLQAWFALLAGLGPPSGS